MGFLKRLLGGDAGMHSRGVGEAPANALAKYVANRDLGWRDFAAGALTTRAWPTSAHLVLTYACNARCRFCSQTAADRRLHLSDRALEVVLGLVPFLGDIDLQGGEVFVDKRLPGILDVLARVGPLPALGVITNGIALDEQAAEKACSLPFKQLAFSLNAANPETYRYLHGVDAFARVVGNMQRVLAARKGPYPRVIARMLVMRSNYREIPQFLGMAGDQGVDQVQLVPLHPAPGIEDLVREETIPEDQVPECAGLMHQAVAGEHPFHVTAISTYPQVREAINRALEALRAAGRPTEPPGDPVPPDQPEPTQPAPEVSRPGICHLAWDRLLVDTTGEVKVCCLSRNVLGNINRQRLEEIWNGRAMQQMRQALLRRDYGAAGCSEMAANCRFQSR